METLRMTFPAFVKARKKYFATHVEQIKGRPMFVRSRR